MASSREGAHHKVGEVMYFYLKQQKPSSNLIYQYNMRRQGSDGFVVRNTRRSFVPEPNPQSSDEGITASLGSPIAGWQLAIHKYRQSCVHATVLCVFLLAAAFSGWWRVCCVGLVQAWSLSWLLRAGGRVQEHPPWGCCQACLKSGAGISHSLEEAERVCPLGKKS